MVAVQKWSYSILALILVMVCGIRVRASVSGGLKHTLSEMSVLSEFGKGTNPKIFKTSPRFVYGNHIASNGETLKSIASDYGTDINSLIAANKNIKQIPLSGGNTVKVFNKVGTLYNCKEKDTLSSVAKRYLPAGYKLDKFKKEIIEQNYLPAYALISEYHFKNGTQIIIPKKGEKSFVALYSMPLRSYLRVTSNYGSRYHPTQKTYKFHKGCDIKMPMGTPVYASRSGVVTYSGWRRGYGNTIEILHSDGSHTRYAHLSAVLVKKGASVKRSETLIGKVGSSGIATGAHLHFEIITPSGKSVNPIPRLAKK